MIYFASGRCDIIAFYYPWFLNRLQQGYVDVRNPIKENLVTRYSLAKKDVDALVICTKNPLPILKKYEPLLSYPVLLQVTITPYARDLEPLVPKKTLVIEAVKQLSAIFGKNHVMVRYDPIIVNEKYTIAAHLSSFSHLADELKDYVDRFIISFVDEYKNTRRHHIEALNYKQITALGEGLGQIAKEKNIIVQTCAEPHDLSAYGIPAGLCMDPEKLSEISGKTLDWTREKGKRDCGCADYRDIGAYNCCMHVCRYCYANYDEDIIRSRTALHDPDSSMLIGHLEEDDHCTFFHDKHRQIRLFD